MAIASPFAETDAVASLPPLQDHFMVRCGKCGKEYRYEPSDVFRYEQRPPDSFTPHPLFEEEQ